MSRDRDRRDARINPAPATSAQAPAAAPTTEPGPAPEKWAYAPGVTPEDIAAAEHWCRANKSSSPIHMIAADYMLKRTRPDLDEEARRELWHHVLAEARKLANGVP
jgi:hypothetical protein